MNPKIIELKWTGYAHQHLVGRTIIGVHYATKEEADQMGVRNRPLMLALDNGTVLWMMSDNPGNDGGALHGVLFDDAADPLLFPTL